MTEKNKGHYCHKCVHAREKVIPRCWICKLNCVQRNQADVCLWDSKKNPSKFEPIPENPKCKDCVIHKYENPELWCKNGCIRTDGDLIQKLREFIKANNEDGSCPFGSMNEGNCHEYNNEENGGCSLCIFDHAVGSLIKGDPPK